MNAEVIFQILQLAISLVQTQFKGKPPLDLSVEQILIGIIQKALAAYRQHVGEPLDVSLIKEEAEV